MEKKTGEEEIGRTGQKKLVLWLKANTLKAVSEEGRDVYVWKFRAAQQRQKRVGACKSLPQTLSSV